MPRAFCLWSCRHPRILLLSLALLAFPLVDSAPAADAPASTLDIAEILAGEAPESIDQLRAMQEHVKKLTEKIVPCTVGVRVGGAAGSGVIIDKEGHVLTAAHVCGKPGRDVVFLFADGKTAKGKTLGTNHGIDSGLMKITDKGDWPYVEMGDYDTIHEGQWVLATGHPGGYQKDRGTVLRLGRVLNKRNSVVTTDCTLVGGDSGGPLYDMEGRVIGIHSRIGGALTSNMHVPIDTYQDTWERLAAAEDWGGILGRATGPFIGVVGEPGGESARIAQVQDDSPAAKAGLKENDLILEFGKKEIQTFADLAGAVQGSKPGDKVKLKVKRGDETLELELVIGKRD